MLRPLIAAFGIMCLLITSVGVEVVNAAEHAPLASGPELPVPSIWRVLLVFAFVGAIAFSASSVLRRFKPWLIQKGIASATAITVVSQRKLARGLDVYVISVEKERYMIVHSTHSTVVSRVTEGIDLPISNINAITGHPIV